MWTTGRLATIMEANGHPNNEKELLCNYAQTHIWIGKYIYTHTSKKKTLKEGCINYLTQKIYGYWSTLKKTGSLSHCESFSFCVCVCVFACVWFYIMIILHTLNTLHIHFPHDIWTFPQTSVAIPLPPPTFFSCIPVDETIHLNPIRHPSILQEPPTCKHMSQHSNTVVTAYFPTQPLWICGGV